MKSKKGIELSVNFLVMTILAIAVFSMGIIFVNKIFRGAAQKTADFDAQTKAELARLLENGEKVALPFYRATVRGGETHSFGVGILNVQGENEKFELQVEFTKAFNPDNSQMCEGGDTVGCTAGGVSAPSLWLVYAEGEEKTLKNHEQSSHAIAISVPKNAKRGTYIYDVKVWYDEDNDGDVDTAPPDALYDSIQKIWVTVI